MDKMNQDIASISPAHMLLQAGIVHQNLSCVEQALAMKSFTDEIYVVTGLPQDEIVASTNHKVSLISIAAKSINSGAGLKHAVETSLNIFEKCLQHGMVSSLEKGFWQNITSWEKEPIYKLAFRSAANTFDPVKNTQRVVDIYDRMGFDIFNRDLYRAGSLLHEVIDNIKVSDIIPLLSSSNRLLESVLIAEYSCGNENKSPRLPILRKLSQALANETSALNSDIDEIAGSVIKLDELGFDLDYPDFSFNQYMMENVWQPREYAAALIAAGFNEFVQPKRQKLTI